MLQLIQSTRFTNTDQTRERINSCNEFCKEFSMAFVWLSKRNYTLEERKEARLCHMVQGKLKQETKRKEGCDIAHHLYKRIEYRLQKSFPLYF